MANNGILGRLEALELILTLVVHDLAKQQGREYAERLAERIWTKADTLPKSIERDTVLSQFVLGLGA